LNTLFIYAIKYDIEVGEFSDKILQDNQIKWFLDEIDYLEALRILQEDYRVTNIETYNGNLHISK